MNAAPVRPNLFIVGAPKCGTTSLHHYLKQHPDVYMSDKKEPHYFATDFHASSDRLHGHRKYFPLRDAEAYAALFADAGAASIVGESSTSYLYSGEAAARIASHAPDARIVICLRDPFTLLRSWHSYLHYCLEEDIEDFGAALDAEPGRKAAAGARGTMPASTQHPERLYYREFIRLSVQIERYLACFPREQLHFVVLEQLERDPHAVYRGLLAFLNLREHLPEGFEVRNARSVRRSGMLSTLQRDVVDRLSKARKPRLLKALVPQGARAWAYRMLGKTYATLDRVNTVKGPQRDYPVDAALERALRQELSAEVHAIERLCRCPGLASSWGYADASAPVAGAPDTARSTAS